MNRCLYSSSFNDFLAADTNLIFGLLCENYHGEALTTTREAWIGEISIMKEVLRKLGCDGKIIFEYDIPRLGKRIDVVLLLKGIIFCLEFKVGEKKILEADIDQVLDYAIDLKNFHKFSENQTQIARKLNEMGAISPVVWKHKVGWKYKLEKVDHPEIWTVTAVRRILSNPVYLGHTINFRTRKKSYKSHSVVFLPKEDWVVFENTHEPIIDKDTFDTVQKLREGIKRRLSIDGEMSVFSGLLYCADCGSKMYLNRHRGKEKDCFNCASYRKEKHSQCTSHYITLHAIEEIVLGDLQRVLGMAKEREQEFATLLRERNKRVTQKDLSVKRKEFEEAEKRIAALDLIIQSLYEDKVSGTLSEERFIKMSENYEREQAILTEKVKALKEEVDAAQRETEDIGRFLRLVKKYTEITELTPEIVRSFIDKILVHKGEKARGGHKQTIEIIYNCVGAIPDLNENRDNA